jgi:hypothetical protein
MELELEHRVSFFGVEKESSLFLEGLLLHSHLNGLERLDS